MITRIDRNTTAVLAQRVQEALAPLGAELGIVIKIGGGKFGPGYYEPKLRLSLVTEAGVVASPEAVAFQRYAHLIGFASTDLGREFLNRGQRFKLTGYRTRAPKRPLLAVEVATGKPFAFPVVMVKDRLI